MDDFRTPNEFYRELHKQIDQKNIDYDSVYELTIWFKTLIDFVDQGMNDIDNLDDAYLDEIKGKINDGELSEDALLGYTYCLCTFFEKINSGFIVSPLDPNTIGPKERKPLAYFDDLRKRIKEKNKSERLSGL